MAEYPQVLADHDNGTPLPTTPAPTFTLGASPRR